MVPAPSSDVPPVSGPEPQLPTFKPPELQSVPADLREDDFLVVNHPHDGRLPVIQHFEDFSQAPPPQDPSTLNTKPWDPFNSRLDFEFAEFALDAALNQGQISRLLELVHGIADHREDFSFKSYTDVKGAWDLASCVSPSYKEHEISVEYKKNDIRTYTMHCRSLWEWSLGLIKDPFLAPKFTWHAQRLYKMNGQTGGWERFVDEPYTADNWWKTESSLPPNASPVMYQLYADKTRLSSFGKQKGYPIIARIANLPAHIRNSDGYGGGQVVGFLPIVEDEEEEGKKGFTTFKRVVWHKAFWILLQDLALWAKHGYKFQCGDGITRYLYPIILILVADYEEQAMMALIRGPNGKHPCPVCLVPQNKQSELGLVPQYQNRDCAEAKALVEDKTLKGVAREQKFKSLGLRPVENVFWKVPHCDVYRALSWDRLHAYHGGLFSDHLFAQLQEIAQSMGRDVIVEINAQFDAMPTFSGLNHFSATMFVKFTDGKKYQHIAKVIVQVTHNVMSQSRSPCGYLLLKCIRCYVVLDMLSGLEVQVEATLRLFAESLVKFSKAIKYEEHYPDKSWNFPKIHTHEHMISDVIGKGVTSTYNSKHSEKMHGLLKGIYIDMTNFKNVDSQMAKIEHQISVAKAMRAHLDALDELTQKPEKPKKPDPFQCNQVHLGARKKPVSLAKLEEIHSNDPTFTRFRLKLEEYLNENYSTGDNRVYLRLRKEEQVTESQYLKVDFESVVTWQLETDHIRCNPSFQNAARYDSVIYKVDDEHYGFAQLRFIFLFKFRDTLYPLALVQPFQIVTLPRIGRSQTDRDLGLCRLRAQPTTDFIPVTSITCAALITEDFGRQGDFLAIDTVDSDMFMHFRRDFPLWSS
ncbi:hypothetical protein C8Q79DRAFT_905404 [Trametes meyenii]|nr:hypothetical protein C8Q79DRAFT_905404 [Trametes meyenii]